MSSAGGSVSRLSELSVSVSPRSYRGVLDGSEEWESEVLTLLIVCVQAAFATWVCSGPSRIGARASGVSLMTSLVLAEGRRVRAVVK
jgi:hypothetical protein